MSVVSNITYDQIHKFIRRLNFTHRVVRGVESLIYRSRKPDPESLKNIDNDVEMIKEFLREKIGRDFATATTPSDANQLGLDMSDHGGNRNARGRSPWMQMRETMQNYRAYVRTQVTDKCPWHKWL